MRARVAREDGFTMVEVLVSLVVTVLVLSAVLGSVEAFQRGARANERLTGAQDAARQGMTQMVRVLRSAGEPSTSLAQSTTVQRALPDDLVVRTTDFPDESRQGTGVHRVRYCLSADRKTLWQETLREGAAVTGDPGTGCPGTAPGWQRRIAVAAVANKPAEPVFTYGSSSTGIRSVGVLLAIQAGDGARDRPTPLRSAATLRGAVLPEVGPGNVTPVCQPDGSGTLLTLGLSLDGDGNPLTLLPSGTGASAGVSVGPAQVLVPRGVTAVQLVVKNALGLQKLLLKEVPAC